jgi:CBS domain-containing protein
MAFPSILPHVETADEDIPLMDILYMASEKGNSIIPVVDREGELKHIFNSTLMVSKITRHIRSTEGKDKKEQGGMGHGTDNKPEKKRVKLLDIALFVFEHQHDPIEELFLLVNSNKGDAKNDRAHTTIPEINLNGGPWSRSEPGSGLGLCLGSRKSEVGDRTFTEAEVVRPSATLGQVAQQMIENHLEAVVCLNQEEVVGMLDVKYLLKKLAHTNHL